MVRALLCSINGLKMATFSWPRNSNEAKELSAQQLDWLLQGLNPLPIRKIQAVRPGSFY